MSIIPVNNYFACKVKEYTSKHALQLVRVFETASLFQLRDHTRLRFVRCRYAVNKTLRKFCGVESLEDILLLKVLEYDHLWDAL